MIDQLMTAREVADYIRKNYDTVLRWAKNGRIPLAGRTPDGDPRFKKTSIDTWLVKNK